MAAKVPIRAVYTNSVATGLGEFQSGEFIDYTIGGTGLAALGSAGQVLKVNSGADALEYGNVEAVLNIDGMTDGSGITLAASDKFALSDGGTEKYLLASQIKSYIADVTLTTAAQSNITSVGTLTTLTVDNVIINGTNIGHTSDTDLMTVADGVLTIAGELDAATLDISGNADIDGTLEADAYTVDGTALDEYIADTIGAMVGSNTETGIAVTYQDGDNTLDFVIGTLNQDTTGTAATVTTAAQPNITSLGTLTTLQVDNININGNAITSTAGTDLTISPLSGQQIVLDSTIIIDAGVVTGATSITSTAFVGDITGDVTGNADTATALASARTIGGTSFDGTANIAVALAATATALATARTIGGTSFDGTANIAVALSAEATALATARTIGGTSFDGTANIAVALAATTTALASARTIGGVSFDGTANINLPGVNTSGSQDTTGTAAKVTVTDSTANTNFPVTFHDESNALLDDTGALRYNPSTGTLLVPNLTVAGTTTQVDTVTMNAANAVIFEGATADNYETTLSIVDPTADRTQYLINQGGYIPVLAASTTTAISSTPAELNILDGATVVVGEINALDLGSTAVGTAIASKAVILDSNKDYTGLRNLTITGELDAATLDISGNADIDGTLEADAYTVDGTALNEYIADTIGAMVGSNTETGIAVTYQDGDNTLDFVVGTLNQDTTGLAGTATALATGRTIGMTGDVVWTSPSFDGSGNVTAAATIQANAVEGSMLNTDVISGQTALTSGLAETDELLVSDGGTIKRMDMSVLLELTEASATALAIALG